MEITKQTKDQLIREIAIIKGNIEGLSISNGKLDLAIQTLTKTILSL